MIKYKKPKYKYSPEVDINTNPLAYTYILIWFINGVKVWYYGSRSANKLPPEEDLWKEYFTSSKYVQMYRDYVGEPDIIEVRQNLIGQKLVLDWEGKFLEKTNAVKSRYSINMNCRGICFNFCGKHSEETKKRISKTKLTDEYKNKTRPKLLKRYYNKPNPFLGRKHTEEAKARMSENRKRVSLLEETIKKMSAAQIKRFSNNPNPFLGRKHTEETKQKMRDAQLRRSEEKRKQAV